MSFLLLIVLLVDQVAGRLQDENKSSSKKPKKGASIASDRLMRELKKVHKSDMHKSGKYQVELVDDNLYEWRVLLSPSMFDSEKSLYGDLSKLKRRSEKDHVELRFSFDENYPFSPPFVRVVYPYLVDGPVQKGGSICMELLSPKVSNHSS